jgi:hypothetical protein
VKEAWKRCSSNDCIHDMHFRLAVCQLLIVVDFSKRLSIRAQYERAHERVSLKLLGGQASLYLWRGDAQLRKPRENTADNTVAPDAHKGKRIFCVRPDS